MPAPAVADHGTAALFEPLDRPEQRRAGRLRVGRRGDGQPGGIPSKQSTIGGRRALPAGIRNSATSVIHSSSGPSARKRRSPRPPGGRFGGAADVSPPYEPHRRFFLAAHAAEFSSTMMARTATRRRGPGFGPGVDPGDDAPASVGAAAGPERLRRGSLGGGVLLGLTLELGVPGVPAAALGHAQGSAQRRSAPARRCIAGWFRICSPALRRSSRALSTDLATHAPSDTRVPLSCRRSYGRA